MPAMIALSGERVCARIPEITLQADALENASHFGRGGTASVRLETGSVPGHGEVP
jgi:hypothetical protein